MGKLALDEENHWVDWVTDAEVPEQGRLEWGMLEHNDIEGFLHFEYIYVDNQLRFRYFYTGMHPVTSFLQEKQGDFGDCRALLVEVLEIIVRGQEYLLDERGYLLKPEWVFWNCHEKRVALCYLPGEKHNISEDFIRLVEFLMKHMDHKNMVTVEMVYRLYDVIKTDGLQAEKTLFMLREFQPETFFQGSGEPIKSFRGEEPQKFFQPFGEGLDSGIVGNTAANTGQVHGNKGRYFLAWKEDALAGKIFWKFPEAVKYLAVEGETTVGRSGTCTHVLPFLHISRKQAAFFEENGRLYLTDTASCNGTWLNGIRLPPGEKMECLPGDRVRFADITYFISER